MPRKTAREAYNICSDSNGLDRPPDPESETFSTATVICSVRKLSSITGYNDDYAVMTLCSCVLRL